MTDGTPVRVGVPAALLVVAMFVVFNANGREIGTYDSQSSKYLALEIARRHSLSLGHVVGRTPQLGERPAFVLDRHGNYRTAYPLPSALAAGATAWLLSAAGLVDLDAPLTASLVAKLTASALTALAVGCGFVAAARRTSRRHAVLVAVGFGLGTNLWAAVSQTLWQQETALAALMGAIVLLARRDATVRHALLSGLLLGLAGWARPQIAPAVLVLGISMVARWRWRGAAGLVPIAVTAIVAISINVAWFGHPLGAVPALEALHPAVHRLSGTFARKPEWSALGLLFSPSRGLFVFSPVVLVAATGLGRARREGWHSELAWCVAAATAQFCAYSLYGVWWGGHTFGPRYALDVLPPLVPLAAAGLEHALRRPPVRVAAAVCLVWSVLVAGAGAFVYPADAWNNDPADVDQFHQRLWEWRDSQIPRVFHSGPSPQNFALFSAEAWRRAPAPLTGR